MVLVKNLQEENAFQFVNRTCHCGYSFVQRDILKLSSANQCHQQISLRYMIKGSCLWLTWSSTYYITLVDMQPTYYGTQDFQFSY